MNADEYGRMFDAEERHWWYRGMAAISHSVLERRLGPPRAELDVLDAGCGTGATSRQLERWGRVTGIDLAHDALRFCRERDMSALARASVASLPFGNGSFDLVASFDVLCSCDPRSESSALREFARVLRPGGHLFLRLPAYDWLRGKHDRAVHIQHRYARGELRRKLAGAGFQNIRASYANSVLFPAAAAVRLSEPFRPGPKEGSDLDIASDGLSNRIFERVLRGEARALSSLDLPFGLTVLAIARVA